MKDKLKRKVIFIMMISLVSLLNFNTLTPTSKADVTVHTTKLYAKLEVGEELELGIDNTSSDIKWSTNNKAIVTVSAKGLVKAKKAGKATVTVNADKENYSFVIVVADKEAAAKASVKPTATPALTPKLTLTPTPTPAIQKSQDDKSITVYVTKTGDKYHRSSCRYLSKSKIPISLSEAVKYYSPCSVCNPPQ